MKTQLSILFLILSLPLFSQVIEFSGKDFLSIRGVHEINPDTKIVICLDTKAQFTSSIDKNIMKVYYLDNSLYIKDSTYSEGFIDDSLMLMSISNTIYKNGLLYFTQDMKSKYGQEYRIKTCSFDPITKEFIQYSEHIGKENNLQTTYTTAISNASTNFVYFSVNLMISNFWTFPSEYLLFNTDTKHLEIPSYRMEMSSIIWNDHMFSFADKIYLYNIDTDSASVFKYRNIITFGPEAFGAKIDDSFYFNGRVAGGRLGNSISKYDFIKDDLKYKFINTFNNTCIVPSLSYDDMTVVNNRLYLPFTTIDNRICDMLKLVAVDSSPNQYGFFVFDKDLNLLDTILYQNDDYRLATLKFSVNDSIIALAGQVFTYGSLKSTRSFVHFINVNPNGNNVSINNPILEEKISIIPNPTTKFITIKNEKNLDIQFMRILNNQGVPLTQWMKYDEELDVEKFKSGVYLLQILTNNQKINTLRFVKI